MNYVELRDFVHKRMRMTHIYQPLMIKTLLESNDNKARTEDIARAFLNEDNAQLEYYKKIVRRWPSITLKKHNVVSYKKEVYTLLLDEPLNGAEKKSLAELCDLRLQEFIDKDPQIRQFRMLDSRAVSGSVRYDILSKSKGLCVACGMGPPAISLHVDHIIPYSLGGPTEMANLQALCYKCNTQKRNRDETDFIRWKKRLQFRRTECPLCKQSANALMENNLAYAVAEKGSNENILVCPFRHVDSFVNMIPVEKQLCVTLVDQVIEKMRLDGTADRFRVSGFDSSGEDHCRISITPH